MIAKIRSQYAFSAAASVLRTDCRNWDRLICSLFCSSRDKTIGATYLDPLQIGSTFQFDVFTNRHKSCRTGS